MPISQKLKSQWTQEVLAKFHACLNHETDSSAIKEALIWRESVMQGKNKLVKPEQIDLSTLFGKLDGASISSDYALSDFKRVRATFLSTLAFAEEQLPDLDCSEMTLYDAALFHAMPKPGYYMLPLDGFSAYFKSKSEGPAYERLSTEEQLRIDAEINQEQREFFLEMQALLKREIYEYLYKKELKAYSDLLLVSLSNYPIAEEIDISQASTERLLEQFLSLRQFRKSLLLNQYMYLCESLLIVQKELDSTLSKKLNDLFDQYKDIDAGTSLVVINEALLALKEFDTQRMKYQHAIQKVQRYYVNLSAIQKDGVSNAKLNRKINHYQQNNAKQVQSGTTTVSEITMILSDVRKFMLEIQGDIYTSLIQPRVDAWNNLTKNLPEQYIRLQSDFNLGFVENFVDYTQKYDFITQFAKERQAIQTRLQQANLQNVNPSLLASFDTVINLIDERMKSDKPSPLTEDNLLLLQLLHAAIDTTLPRDDNEKKYILTSSQIQRAEILLQNLKREVQGAAPALSAKYRTVVGLVLLVASIALLIVTHWFALGISAKGMTLALSLLTNGGYVFGVGLASVGLYTATKNSFLFYQSQAKKQHDIADIDQVTKLTSSLSSS